MGHGVPTTLCQAGSCCSPPDLVPLSLMVGQDPMCGALLQAPQCSTLCSSSADCDSYCKPAKGNYKINMKKYCKKDYGKDLFPPWATLGFATEAAEGRLQAGHGWGRCRCPRGWGAPSMERGPQIRALPKVQ